MEDQITLLLSKTDGSGQEEMEVRMVVANRHLVVEPAMQHSGKTVENSETFGQIDELSAEEIVDCKVSTERVVKGEEESLATILKLKILPKRTKTGLDGRGSKWMAWFADDQGNIRFRFKSYENCNKMAEVIWLASFEMRQPQLDSTGANQSPDDEKGPNHYPGHRSLVLVNPKSGAGHAKRLARTEVVKTILEAGNPCDLAVTRQKDHAKNIVAGFPDLLGRYSRLVIVSGDGLLHEVLQGLAARSDWKKACKIPMSIIPAGSGNGLVCSMAYYREALAMPLSPAEAQAGGLLPTFSTSRLIRESLRGLHTNLVWPTDALLVERPGQPESTKPHISSLAISCGLFTDIDLESEKLRWPFGSLRFQVLGLLKVLLLPMKKFRARISYLPALPEDEASASSGPTGRSGWTTVEDEYTIVVASSKPWLSADCPVAPRLVKPDSGCFSLFLANSAMSRFRMFQFAAFNQCDTQWPGVQMIPVTAFEMTPLENGGPITVDGETVAPGPIRATLLPRFLNISC